MKFKHQVCGDVDLSGSMTKQVEDSFFISSHTNYQFHIEKIGGMVEELESSLRAAIEEIYFKKTQFVAEI